jgi:hypothetical protein
MEVLLDKAWGVILALVSVIGGTAVHLHKRNSSEVRQVAKDLSEYKEQQARETEMHRSRMAEEMSDLKARLEGVTTALLYINKNISDIQSSVGTIAAIMKERK